MEERGLQDEKCGITDTDMTCMRENLQTQTYPPQSIQLKYGFFTTENLLLM